jgi:hypothetical protein
MWYVVPLVYTIGRKQENKVSWQGENTRLQATIEPETFCDTSSHIKEKFFRVRISGEQRQASP